MLIVNGKSQSLGHIAVTSLLLTSGFVYIAASKEYLKRIQITFCFVRITILLAIWSEIFIQMVTFSKSNARKQKWVFFLNTVLGL